MWYFKGIVTCTFSYISIEFMFVYKNIINYFKIYLILNYQKISLNIGITSYFIIYSPCVSILCISSALCMLLFSTPTAKLVLL